MKKVLWFSAVLFVIALGMRVSASAETKKIGNFKYEYDSAPFGALSNMNMTVLQMETMYGLPKLRRLRAAIYQH